MYPIERPLHDTERRKIVAEIRISFSTFYSWPTERGADPADNNSRTEAEWRSEQNGNAAWFMTDDVCLFSRDSFVIGSSSNTWNIFFYSIIRHQLSNIKWPRGRYSINEKWIRPGEVQLRGIWEFRLEFQSCAIGLYINGQGFMSWIKSLLSPTWSGHTLTHHDTNRRWWREMARAPFDFAAERFVQCRHNQKTTFRALQQLSTGQ